MQDNPANNTRSRTHRWDMEVAYNVMEAQFESTQDYARAASAKLIGLACTVMDADTGKELTYRQLLNHPKYRKDWNISAANEFGRLAQGVGGRIEGSDTIRFIPLSNIPHDRLKNVTYGKFVCELKPNKKEVNRTRLTVGGDRINYPGDCSTPTADLVLIKTHLNSVISKKGARYMTLDIKNFYLNTPMKRPEYVRIKLSDILDEIIQEYKLHNIANPEGYIYIEVNKGMYGLPQAGILAQELLEQRLNKHGYFQSKFVPGLWKHVDRPISFTLVVDDFGVKYIGKQHAQHLISVLKEHYEIRGLEWLKNIGLTSP